MSVLFLQGDGYTYDGIDLTGESSLTISLEDNGTAGLTLDYLVLSGTTSVSIYSSGETGGYDDLGQLADRSNVLTTVTLKGSQPFTLGSPAGTSNGGDGVVTFGDTLSTKIASSLTLINASATTGGVTIFAGATNTPSDGAYVVNEVSGETITYTGLTIKGGSGNDFIENDAKNGIVTDRNGTDTVVLGGAGATAKLGTGTGDDVAVGVSFLGTNEAAGDALGDKVTFGAPARATLSVDTGAEAGSTAGTASIGETMVNGAASGMTINFSEITTSSSIIDENTAVVGATSLTAAENAAVNAMHGAGVAYFNYHGSEYFIATNNAETSVSSHDAIVKLVGVVDLTATNAGGIVHLT